MSKDYYQTLELNKDASDEEIKKSFRRLSLKYHPDRNPNGIDGLSREECEEKYKSIVEAHSILSDPDKKREYLEGGKQFTFNPFGGNAGNVFNMFGNMFGINLNFGNGPQIIQKVLNVSLTLEDVHQGYHSVKSLKIETPCKSCSSTGKKEVITCGHCNGSGRRTIIQRIGPSMMTQQIINCDNCNQKGKIGSGDNCTECNGKCNTERIVNISVNFPIGVLESSQYKYRLDNFEFVFVAHIEPHYTFSRQGNNLTLNKKISLLEALTGLQFHLKLLDGREICVKSGESEIIKPNGSYILKNLGIGGGDIIINFTIEFPDKIEQENIQKLKEILGGERKEENSTNEDFVYYLEKV